MADIELVIKIPEKMYKDIQSHDWKNGERWYSEEWRAIHNGTPLPKGHGELADIRPLMRGLYEEMCVGELTYTTSEVYKMLENEAPTIIEANKEYEAEVITRGKCMMCGKELTEGLFFCKECGNKANSGK